MPWSSLHICLYTTAYGRANHGTCLVHLLTYSFGLTNLVS